MSRAGMFDAASTGVLPHTKHAASSAPHKAGTSGRNSHRHRRQSHLPAKCQASSPLHNPGGRSISPTRQQPGLPARAAYAPELSTASGTGFIFSSNQDDEFMDPSYNRRRQNFPSARRMATSTTATDVIMRYFEAFNDRDLDGMAQLIAQDCLHQGLANPQPYVGKQAVKQFYRDFLAALPRGIQIVVDDMTEGDPAAVGVTWHLEFADVEMPFGRGMGFFKTNWKSEITYIRETPEHVVKLTSAAALPALNMAGPLLRQLGPVLEPFGSLATALIPRGPTAATFQRLLPPSGFQSGSSYVSTNGAYGTDFRAPQGASSSGAGSNADLESAKTALLELNAELEQTRREKERLEAQLLELTRADAAAADPQAFTRGDDQSIARNGSGIASTPSGEPVGMVELGPPPQLAQADRAPRPRPNLSGIWLKDFAASDMESYSRACDIMRLGGLQKTTALQLIEGLQIEQTPSKLSTHFLTVVPFFKVTETLVFGSETKLGRRDLRRGKQTGTVRETPEGFEVTFKWGEPYSGTMIEVFSSPEANVLHVESTVDVGGNRETTLQVYRKEKDWKPKNKMTPQTFGMSSFPLNPWAGH